LNRNVARLSKLLGATAVSAITAGGLMAAPAFASVLPSHLLSGVASGNVASALTTVTGTLDSAVTSATKAVTTLVGSVGHVNSTQASARAATKAGSTSPAPSACPGIIFCPTDPQSYDPGSESPYPTGSDAPQGPNNIIPTGSVSMQNGGILQQVEWDPFNTNMLTNFIPVEAPALNSVLPGNIGGVIVNRNYAYDTENDAVPPTIQERAGEAQIPTGTNDPNWRASSTSIYVPGVTRVATVEFACPGMGGVDNPNGAYTGQTYIEPANRTVVLSWAFGDRVVNFYWIYSHYLVYSLIGGGGSGHTGTTGSVMGMGNTNPSSSMSGM
jgi:hypothetical protein